ncbi:Thiamine-phosphate synthase [Rickettsiales bacterium Ac37b]|nr:Thiamine-phosphate synthase [Rickettsiales bacterium Ac37b]
MKFSSHILKQISRVAMHSNLRGIPDHLSTNLRQSMKLCLVTNRQEKSFSWLMDVVEKAAKGGVTMVQLREKDNIPDKDTIYLAELLLNILKEFNVPLIINDRVDICHITKAQGVHLGQSDMHPDKARKILGDKAIIGLSLENLEQAEIANRLTSINYVAASPVFHSNSKNDYNGLWGLQGLKELTQISKYPVMSIGGINLNNVSDIIGAGSKGVAVISAVQNQDNPELAAKLMYKEIDNSLRRYDNDRCR